MKKLEVLLFDFGRVLGNFDKQKACKCFAESSPYSADQILEIIVNGQFEKHLESGQMSETAFCRELMFQCKIDGLTVPDVRRIWGNIFSPNPAIDPVISDLIARNVPIGVLSNTNSIHWPYIEDLPIMRALIDYRAPFVLSHLVKAYKPDRRMFETALKRLRARPENTLYIDDMQEYVDAARAVGMEAERYDCRDTPERISWILAKNGFRNELV